MRILDFSVEGQKLEKNGDFSSIIKGSKGYLKCRFKFNSEWLDHKVVVIFERNKKETPVLLNKDKTCMIPDETTQTSSFKIKLVGDKNGKRITTNDILIEQEE